MHSINSTVFLDFYCLEHWTETIGVLLGHDNFSGSSVHSENALSQGSLVKGTEPQSMVKYWKQKSSLPGPLSQGKRSMKDVVIPGLERIISWKAGGGGQRVKGLNSVMRMGLDLYWWAWSRVHRSWTFKKVLYIYIYRELYIYMYIVYIYMELV